MSTTTTKPAIQSLRENEIESLKSAITHGTNNEIRSAAWRLYSSLESAVVGADLRAEYAIPCISLTRSIREHANDTPSQVLSPGRRKCSGSLRPRRLTRCWRKYRQIFAAEDTQ